MSGTQGTGGAPGATGASGATGAPGQRMPGRPGRASRRVGYVVAVIVNAILVWLVSGWHVWWDMPWLTDAFVLVRPAIILVLAISIAEAVLLFVIDPRWLQALLDAVGAAAGLVAAVLLATVFPFDFGEGSPWTLVVRLAVWAVVIGTALAIVAHLVTFVVRLVGAGARTE